jgi:hypothetical protein
MKVQNTAIKILGHRGRMISGSKGQYSWDNPRNLVKFNANICTAKHGKIWHGDIDVTIEEPKLQKLAKALKEKVYVLSEMDARAFREEESEKESKPKLEKAVVVVDAQESWINESLKQYYVRENGKWLEVQKDKDEEYDYKSEWPEYSLEYKESEYTPFKLPRIYPGKTKVSPLERLYKQLQAEVEKKRGHKKEQKYDIYLMAVDYRKLHACMEEWFIKVHGLKKGTYALQREMNWLSLSMPSEFYHCKIGPVWGKAGYAYLKKVKNLPKNRDSEEQPIE